MLLHDSLTNKDINSTTNLLKLSESSVKGHQLAFNHSGLDYAKFIQDYSHEDCTFLAYWLYDNYGLKLGAVRAIDMNDESDDDYATVVHQFVVLPNELILDARGVGTERDMIYYYQEASVFDDEEWDFLVDYDYEPAVPKNGKRNFDDFEGEFNKFISLLNDCIDVDLRLKVKDEQSIAFSNNKPNYVAAQLKESGFAFDGMATFYCEGIENVRIATSILFDKFVEPDDLSSIQKCRVDLSIKLSPNLDSLVVHDKSGLAVAWNDFSSRPFEPTKLNYSEKGGSINLRSASENNFPAINLGDEIANKADLTPMAENANTESMIPKIR